VNDTVVRILISRASFGLKQKETELLSAAVNTSGGKLQCQRECCAGQGR
jgi:hypothetical protein